MSTSHREGWERVLDDWIIKKRDTPHQPENAASNGRGIHRSRDCSCPPRLRSIDSRKNGRLSTQWQLSDLPEPRRVAGLRDILRSEFGRAVRRRALPDCLSSRMGMRQIPKPSDHDSHLHQRDVENYNGCAFNGSNRMHRECDHSAIGWNGGFATSASLPILIYRGPAEPAPSPSRASGSDSACRSGLRVCLRSQSLKRFKLIGFSGSLRRGRLAR